MACIGLFSPHFVPGSIESTLANRCTLLTFAKKITFIKNIKT